MMKKLAGIFILALFCAVASLAQTAPPSAKDYFDRATALINERKFEQAVAALREAEKLEPSRFEIQQNFESVLAILRKFD